MTLKEIILDVLGKIKATDIVCYDMRGYSPFYDEMIICTVDVERQANAAINYMKEETNKHGFDVRSVEGAYTQWVLIDCYDIVVSIFTKEERDRFALEKLYYEFKKTNF